MTTETNNDRILDIIAEYDGLQGVDSLFQEKVEDNFKALKALCIDEGCTEGSSFDELLEPSLDQYMQNKFNLFLQYAQKRNGGFKYRRFTTPANQNTLLQANNIAFTMKNTKDREGNDIQVCEVKGVPDGFYTAWKTLNRALDNNISLTREMGKSVIDAELSRLRKEQAAQRREETDPYNRFEQARTQIFAAIALIPDTTRRVAAINTLIFQLMRLRDEANRNENITTVSPETEVGSSSSEGSESGADNRS